MSLNKLDKWVELVGGGSVIIPCLVLKKTVATLQRYTLATPQRYTH